MRSQDAFRLLPGDVFVFTLLQEYVASKTGNELGPYHHIAGSFHYYIENKPEMTSYIHSAPEYILPMPAMPTDSQEEHLNRVLDFEERLRNETSAILDQHAKLQTNKYLELSRDLPDFWKLVAHGLIAWSAFKLKNSEILLKLAPEMQPCWRPYVAEGLAQFKGQKPLL